MAGPGEPYGVAMTWVGWVAVAAAVLAVVAVVLALQARHAISVRGRTALGSAGSADEAGTATPADRTLVAFVANPTKPGVPALHDTVVRSWATRRQPAPLWLETTAEDPGAGQTRAALAQGARLVVAVGGDGTIRAVAEGLAGTDVPMGLVPRGTGNLLARNLDLPLGDVEALLRIALGGVDRRIDVGWLTIVRDETPASDDGAHDDARPAAAGAPDATAQDGDSSRDASASASDDDDDDDARDHIFLVIAGLGFDAAMVADTDEDLKAKVGWVAYFVAGVKHLHARRMRLQMSLDDSPWYNVRLRSLLVGNCGKLPGGLTLLPDAELDDGWLDVGAIDTRVGLLGWGQLFGEVALQRYGVRTRLPNKAGRIDHARTRELRVRTREPQQIQVDGDVVGLAVEVAVRVAPLSLTVRVDGQKTPT